MHLIILFIVIGLQIVSLGMASDVFILVVIVSMSNLCWHPEFVAGVASSLSKPLCHVSFSFPYLPVGFWMYNHIPLNPFTRNFLFPTSKCQQNNC